MYRLTFHSYCGMADFPNEYAEDELTTARADVASRLRAARRNGQHVSTLKRGAEWECEEPDGCSMVPDDAGVLTLTRRTFECRECGFGHGSRDDAATCCGELDTMDELADSES